MTQLSPRLRSKCQPPDTFFVEGNLVDDDADSKPPAKDPMMSMMFEAMKKSYPQTDDES